jgi:medium-chain acyl-[acyl-carrier-protein] hydrolase
MRMAEEPIGDLAVLVERLHEALAPFMDRPFAFYGHSNGGLMAYELARSLARAGRRMPLHLFVGGRPAPQLVRNDEPLHALPHDEFIEALRRYNGTPEEVLANPEIMEIISPMLRADFALGETYVHQPGPPLHVPVSAYAGEHDAEVEPREVEAWRERTSGPFVFRVFPGDHFFMVSHRETLLAQMRDELRPLLARLAAAAHA